jgi:hypothetical protein
MTKRQRAKVLSAAVAFARDRMGRRKQPVGYLDGTAEAVQRIIRAFGTGLPAAFLDRAVPYSIDICDRLHVKGAERMEVDPFWVSLYEALAPGKARWAIATAAGSSLFELREREPADRDEAIEYLRLVDMARTSWRSTWADEVEDNVSAANARHGWALPDRPVRKVYDPWGREVREAA